MIKIFPNNNKYLNKLFKSNKPLIIYKVKNGYDVFTDFSQKIHLDNKNIDKFFLKILHLDPNKEIFDGYIGFFDYKLLCNLIGLKINKQKSDFFNKSIFYKPETIIKIRKGVRISSSISIKDREKELNNEIENYKENNFYHNQNFDVNYNLENFKKKFDFAKKKLIAGETYQIKISQKYTNNSYINPINFFTNLMQINCSPESFMIRDKNYSIVSCSPENLIYKKGRKITTKPIAGTLKKNKLMNRTLAKKMFTENEKENKEHNMIIDLERNDLSKICKPGTVKFKNKKLVEEYKDLFHYVSEISGEIKEGVDIKEIITAMMPGGSVIGCPKISTLNIINNLEDSSRNIFTGSFGYIKSNLDMRFNVIIRTILNYNNSIEILAASGIIIDSKYKSEYEENFIKAKSLIDLFKL
tara:strand:+ start:4798 stop:6036 length:1239 start_codon:yes stop_codon:yes gene_type:complete